MPNVGVTDRFKPKPPLASDQNDGGYTALPNALLRVWIPALSGAETAVLMWVIQDTLSWHRNETKPTTYRLIAKHTNLHRHSIERAVSILLQIGLIGAVDSDGEASAYAQSFSINTHLLQKPPLEFDGLVQKLDQMRTRDWSKKRTEGVQKTETFGLKTIPTLVQKKDRPNEEESKELNESKKLAGKEAQELAQEVRDRIARSRLSALRGTPLDDRTVGNICAHLERLSEIWQAKFVLEKMEAKCAAVAQRPHMAESWGLVVTVVRDAVAQLLTQAKHSSTFDGDSAQKPWAWLATEERAALIAARKRSA